MLSIHIAEADDATISDLAAEQTIPLASEDVRLLNGIIARYDALLIEIDALNVTIEETLAHETKTPETASVS